MGDNPSRFKDCGDDCPVERVSWEEAHEYIKRLNLKEGTKKYRLPTEAEWEFACRAGSTSSYSWGEMTTCKNMNYEMNQWNGEICLDWIRSRGLNPESTVPVRSYSSNEWGLYDMHGNVWEWCQDGFSHFYPSGSVTDPTASESAEERVRRGGSWFDFARFCRAASRESSNPEYRNHNIGFRLVRDK